LGRRGRKTWASAIVLERIDARDEEDVEHVPVVRFLDTIAARELGIVEQIPTMFLGDLAADLVGVDDEAVGPDMPSSSLPSSLTAHLYGALKCGSIFSK
jgi:hypothetical protein